MRAVRENAPSPFTAFQALLRADAIVQFHQRRSLFMSFLIPLFFLNAWKRFLPVMGPANVLASCISIGLPAVGLMGYALVIARDRERGVFQRLRTTPCSTWVIMSSRLVVQLVIMLAVAALTLVAAFYMDGIQTGLVSALWVLLAVAVSGAVFLSLGQLLSALFMSTESVNAVTRVVYTLVLLSGVFGQTLRPGSPWHSVLQWSPLGVARTMIAMALSSAAVGRDGLLAVVAALAYTVVFTVIGIRWFRWVAN